MLKRIQKAFRHLDTSEVDAEIAAATRCYRDVQVRARALRRDAVCGDAGPVIARMTRRSADQAGDFLRRIFQSGDTPDDMTAMAGRIP